MSRRAFTNSFDDAPGGPGDDPTLPGRLLASGEALLRDICDATWDSKGRALRSAAGIDGPHVYTGLAGIAYLLFRKWQRSRDPASLATASEMLACCIAADSRRPHTSPTFLTGTVGLLALAAAVAHAREDFTARDAHVAELRAFADSTARLAPGRLPCELLYGRAGLIYACAFVNRHCGEDSIPAALLAPLVAQTLDAGRRGATAADARSSMAPGRGGPPSLPLYYEWHGTPYAGAAHGTAGICHALLLLERHLPPDAARLSDVSGSLRYLLHTRFRSGNFPARTHPPPRAASESASAAPVAAGEEEPGDDKVHWCHGAPGAVLALAGAWEATHDPAFAAGALAAADVVWQRGLLRRASLCHGVAGNLFAFLAAARVARGLAEEATQAGPPSDQAARWLAAAAQQERRARCFARFMTEGPSNAGPSVADSGGLVVPGASVEAAAAAAASDGRAVVPEPSDLYPRRQHWQILVEMEEMHGGDCEASLFEGAAGVAWALCEVGQAASPAGSENGGPYFPGFELPQVVRAK